MSDDGRIFNIKYMQHSCQHIYVELDMESRRVICRACERVIDPFDFLITQSIEETTSIAKLQHLKQEVVKLEKQVAALKKKKILYGGKS